MSDVTVQIKGLDDLKRSLKQFPINVQKNILVASIRAEASHIAKVAKSKVPKKSGNLKRAIKVKKRRTKNKSYIKFSIGLTIGNSAKHDGFYGHIVEFGSSKMSAQPFMRPAYEQSKDNAISSVTTKMKQRIDKEILKVSRA